MTRLLVSVRSACEAVTALAAGADLIDVKEPRRGPLGPADPAVMRAVCRAVAGRVPVSAALGELAGRAWPWMSAKVIGIQYAKLGLAGCADMPGWGDLWARALQRRPLSATPIAVIYADWGQARAPHPSAVLAWAVRLGCGGVLVDTWQKSGDGLLDYMQPSQLADLVAACRSHALLAVLAGSLSQASIPRVLELGPDYIAVRGAACTGGRRKGRIDAARVRDLAALCGSAGSQRAG